MPIIDNFELIINNANRLKEGLMSKEDKIKLDNTSNSDITYIKNNIEFVKETLVPQKIYGILIDPNNANPYSAVEYTDDAVGFTPLTVDDSGICNNGSWDPVFKTLLNIKPCLINKYGKVISYLNPNDYTKTLENKPIDIYSGNFGQVMIEFPKIYYKFSIYKEKLWFQISNKKSDSTWLESAYQCDDGLGSVRDKFYYSAYEGVQVNNAINSLSGHLPVNNLDFDKLREYSDQQLIHMGNIVKKQFITFLVYLVTKSINVVASIGNGNTSNTYLKTGTMNDKGLFYGKKNNQNEGVKVFGIENLWGNSLETAEGLIKKKVLELDVEGMITTEKQYYFFKEFSPYDDIKDYTNIGELNIPDGFIRNIEFKTPCVYLPSNTSGSSSTYFASKFESVDSTDVKDILHYFYSGFFDNTCHGIDSVKISNIKEGFTTRLVI